MRYIRRRLEQGNEILRWAFIDKISYFLFDILGIWKKKIKIKVLTKILIFSQNIFLESFSFLVTFSIPNLFRQTKTYTFFETKSHSFPQIPLAKQPRTFFFVFIGSRLENSNILFLCQLLALFSFFSFHLLFAHISM